jgi:vancomycin resistance protein VanJ
LLDSIILHSKRRDVARGRFVRRLRALILVYVGSAIVWELLPWTPATQWWLFGLLSVFGAWFYAPLPLLGLLSALCREWRACTWLLVPVLLFGWVYGPLFLPHGSSERGRPLRVMTANLLETNNDFRPLSVAIDEDRPDVIAVQELNPTVARPLSEALRGTYPYQSLFPNEASFGMGILSRHPISLAGAPEFGPGDCWCQQATIELEGQAITVVNAHPPAPAVPHIHLGPLVIPTGFDAQRQEASIQALLQRASTINGPLVLLGDFNTSDRQSRYRTLSQHLHDAYRTGGRGLGYTYPNREVDGLFFPVVRIDYVFHSDAWATRAAWTGNLSGSDHRYVTADLVLRS